MDYNNFLSFEKEKAVAFNIFTAFFCRPTEELISDKSIFTKLNSSLEIICPDCQKNVILMGDKIDKYSQLELLVEYTRLFIGPFKIIAQPYSCMYFGGKSLMSDETLWVINYYEKMGLVYDNSIKDSPDHVAVETEFNYYLIYNCLLELENNNIEKAKYFFDGQCDFFDRHYKVWIPLFCKNIIENSNNEFYKALAQCLNDFINNQTILEFPNN